MRFNIAVSGIVAIGVSGLVAATALAHPVKVVGGETELKLHKNTAQPLADLGVDVSGTEYEVVGGEYSFHPLNDEGGGVIKHKGALVFEGDGAKAKFKRFVIDLPVEGGDHESKHGDEGVLMAKVDGKQIDIAHLDTKRYKVLDDEPGFTNLKLELSKAGAKALNEAFDTDLFEEGLKLGKLANQSEVEEIEEH
jgi:hypothetical protein